MPAKRGSARKDGEKGAGGKTPAIAADVDVQMVNVSMAIMLLRGMRIFLQGSFKGILKAVLRERPLQEIPLEGNWRKGDP